MSAEDRVVRIAAVGDVHCARQTQGQLEAVFAQVEAVADVLLLCGDLTDYGTPEETRNLLRELSPVTVPMLAVLGNHDFESGRQDEVAEILRGAGILLLDGDAHEVAGIGFAGVKGFAGGFGRHTLEPWGEAGIKQFVQESVDEAMKLEKALSLLRGIPRVAVLHYSPIAATVAGEPPEIFPFLGSSRLEEPLNRYAVTAAFHGHAHRGSPEGRTSAGVPVYNVAMPLLRRTFPDRPPFRVVEVRIDVPEPALQGAEPRRRKDDHGGQGSEG
jgi:Icc-related predicted phosphoesterase